MSYLKETIIIFLLFLSSMSYAKQSKGDFLKNRFKNKDFCFYMADIKSGKTVVSINQKRCDKRLAPCSTFKIAIAAMAFDSGYFNSTEQKIKWDGKKRWMKKHNKDQTPKSFIQHSVIWASQRIVKKIGFKETKAY